MLINASFLQPNSLSVTIINNKEKESFYKPDEFIFCQFADIFVT